MNPFLTDMRHDPFYPLHRDLPKFPTPNLLFDRPNESELFAVDMDEDDESFQVEAELPGFRREEIELELDDSMLTITAQREPREPRKHRHLSERRLTRVHRRLPLPAPVDTDATEAVFRDGVLEVTLPKSRTTSSHRIEVR